MPWKPPLDAGGPQPDMNLKPRTHDEPEINIVSLIDVVLLLVVFFMLSSRFTDEGRLRVHLPQGLAPAVALLVPDRVIAEDQAGRYVLVVNKDNVVEQNKVETGQLEGGLRVIESGLKPDDRVVIAGLLKVIPGQKVDPQLQKIEQPSASAK